MYRLHKQYLPFETEDATMTTPTDKSLREISANAHFVMTTEAMRERMGKVPFFPFFNHFFSHVMTNEPLRLGEWMIRDHQRIGLIVEAMQEVLPAVHGGLTPAQQDRLDALAARVQQSGRNITRLSV